MDFSKFSQNLAALAKGSGMTINALASEINTTGATLSRYITGERKIPSAENIVKIAQYFNVSTDWLLGLSENKYNTLTDDVREIANLYSFASLDDKRVILAVLAKYKDRDDLNADKKC